MCPNTGDDGACVLAEELARYRARITLRDWMFRLADRPFIRSRIQASVVPPAGKVPDRSRQDRVLSRIDESRG